MREIACASYKIFVLFYCKFVFNVNTVIFYINVCIYRKYFNQTIFFAYFQFFALVLISFGVYVLSSYRVNEVGALAAYSYIGLGVATIVVFLLGFFGAARESVCCTITVSDAGIGRQAWREHV